MILVLALNKIIWTSFTKKNFLVPHKDVAALYSVAIYLGYKNRDFSGLPALFPLV